MTRIYTATDAATELDIDPRALRRFLRNDPTYRNVGMGGRYVFTEAELKSLKHAYAHAAGKGRPRKADEPDPRILDDDPGVPVEKLGRKGLTPSLRAQRQAARAQRQQRLLIRMDAVLERRPDDVTVD